MSDEKDKKNKRLSQDDVDLWREMTDDVQPMPGSTYQQGAPADEVKKEPVIRETVGIPKKQTHQSKFKAKDVDRKTMERLKKGKMPIDATIDLHGMTQAEAHGALIDFIKDSYNRDRRCVLVITGKGKLGPGILRQKVPIWLHDGEIGPLVLQETFAKHHDGGEGALYVLLRRRRPVEPE